MRNIVVFRAKNIKFLMRKVNKLMTILNFNPKRILASFLTFGVFFMYAAPLPVLASEISNINPVSQGGHNVYNINAAKVSGSTGFRHYNNFKLDKGDIANLKFNNYTKFVNLVNNKITINGIVNTMKGNNFYNGHAIFVSPQGFVLGASGVLNVGSLSVLTPSQSKFDTFKSKYDSGDLSDYVHGADKYKELLNDSHGEITMNGKILSRGDVELFGDKITIKGTTADKAGIVAGIETGNDEVYTEEDAAKALFNTLVSNNITDTTNFALEDGKVKIVAGFKEYKDDKPVGASNKAEVLVEDAQISGYEIEIKANSTKDGTYILADTDEAISSTIDIINSGIVGNKVDILANSESSLSRNINITVPTVLLWIFDSDAHLDEYFSEGVYTGFEGVRTKATVTVKDSVINALSDNLSIEATSSSETKIGSQVIGPVELSQFVPAIFYGYGTQTESKIEIVNSTLKSQKDVDLNAFSSNVLAAKIADECVLGINLKMTDAYNLAFMKNSAIADTKITIDNSTVEGENVSMQALAYNEMDNRVILKTRIGKNDFQTEVQGGSSASLAGILNATDIKSSIEVKNNSKVIATEDVEMNAYNINDVSNWVDSEVTDPLGYTKEWQESDKWLLKQFDRLGRTYTAYDQITHFTIKDFTSKFTSKGKNIYSQVWPEDKQTLANANFQAGAGVVWNSAETTNNVVISNSTVSAKNISIKAHTVDATVNETDAYAEEDANWGGAFGLVVNKQTNNNKVDVIDSSKLTAEEDLRVDSIVELPAQQGTFGLSTHGMFGISFTLGLNFGMKPNDEWDFGFHNVGSDAPSEKLIPDIGLFGFYNNFAVASGAGEKASISAAVVYSELNNNSDINITNSTLTSGGDIAMNSVVSASAHDAVDFVNYDGLLDIIKGIKSFNKWNSDGNGGGGAVLVQNFTHNAKITVDNSTLEADEGDINLNTAAEQSYLNLVTPGGKAETIGINGAVSVQKVHGTTGTTIKNESELTANNIGIDSGKVNVQFTKKGSDMGATGLEFLNDDDEVVLADARDAKDHITAVALDGTFTKQTEESESPTSSGLAFGASVIVQNIDRTVKSLVENSTLTANTIDIKSDSYTRNIFVTLAGSFAGGVSPSADTQAQANAGGGGAQEMQNVGNWMDILDNAQPDEEDILGLNNLFNENNPNQQGAQNAQQHANDINNQNAQVNNDGNINNNAGGNNPGNNNGNMAGNAANPQNATSNFSLALAGSVSVVYDESAVVTEIKNSTLNVEKEVSIVSDRDNFMLNASGGLAKSGTVGAGAAVNVYTDKGGAKSIVDNSKILFASDEAAKKVNVTAKDKHYIIDVGVGIGVSGGGTTGGDSQKFDAAIGGSFNTNRLIGTTEAKVTNTSEIKNDFKKDESGKPTTKVYSNDIDVKVGATGDTTIWNAGGDAGIATGGSSEKFQLGAAVAGNMNMLQQKINAEISNSTLTNVKNVDIKSELDQNINSISVAAAVTQRSDYSFNLEGALGLEFIGNSVTALLKDSTVSSSGDVKLLADSDIEGQTLTGDINIQAGKGIGVGIGVVLGIDNSTVSSKIDGSTISKSNSIESKATSVDDRQFLAVNLGLSDSSYQILTNGAVNIYKTTVESKVVNNSKLTSDGAVSLLSNYENKNQGITAIAEKTSDGLAFGANILASYYGNTVKSELENGSNIIKSGSVNIDAGASEKINYIPAALAVATGHASSVGADIVVNVIKNNTYANVYGDVTTIGKFVVKALDDTTIYERGGVLAYSGGGTVGIGSVVYVDYLNKTVQAEVKNNTVYAGDVTVQATAVNSFGGTKKSDGTWDVSDMSTDASSYGENFHENSSFKNWTMAYSLAHGDSAGASGSVIVRVLDDILKANVEGVNLGSDDNKASSLKIYANDYTIMNTVAGQFTPSDIAAGGNAIFAFANTDVQATLTGGTQVLTGDLNIGANSEKLSHTVLVGGSGADKVAVNGAVYVNKTTDKVTSSVVGSTVTADKVTVDSRQKNDSLGVDVSVAGSGKASVGGILYLNLYNDTTKALVGDNDKARTSITSTGDIKVNSDSDYEAREYLVSVAASGNISISGMGIANVMDSTIESGVYNSDITSNNGKLDVNAYRGFNKGSSGKTAFFRNWFKGTDAYAKQNSQITASDLSGMAPIVGALNVSASGTGAGSGTIIVNKSRGSLTSKIDNSTVSTKNGTKVLALQDFTNFDAVAAVAGSANASLNGVGVINSLVETVTAEVSDSTASKGSITTDAQSNMNLNQLVISGEGAGQGAAVGVVVDSNYIEDKVHSYITGTTAEDGAGANSAHNIMINNIMLAGGGVGQGLSANVAVVLNRFVGAETLSKIDGSTINGGDITLTSFDNLDNLSAIVGVSVAGQGANLSGYAIRNELGNKSKSYITNASTINTTGAINIFADSVVSTTNAIFSAGIVGQGASVLANVISNTITSEVEGYIEDSTITEAGDIKITANVNNDTNKYRYDEMTNTTGNVSFAAQGASLATNVIYTNYSNTVKTYIENTSSDSTGNITLDANTERRLNNINIGIGAAAIGAAVAVNAISTTFDTKTSSYIDTKSKTMDNVGAIKAYSRDNSDINNKMGTIQVAGLGAAAGVGLDMTWNSALAKSEILSNSDGQINASSAKLESENILEYGNTNVGVSLGAVGLAGDYVLIKSGKRTGTYSQSEKDSKIDTAIGYIDSKYTPAATPADTKTGAISNINGNLKTTGDIAINAESKIKGRGADKELSLTNVTTTVGIGAGSVGVKDVDLASNTNASITGGKVESENKDISINAKNTSNVKLRSVEVDVSGVKFSGGSALYTNSSETTAQIKDATVNGDNINVVSDSTSVSDILATFVTVTGGNIVAVDLSENKDTNKSIALVTGNTNIDAGGKLTLHSTTTTDLKSDKKTVKVEGVNMVSVSKNEVNASTINKALIENVTGEIKTHGLDITTDYGTMSTYCKSNVVAVDLGGVASVDKSGAYMNASFTSGINSPAGLVLENIGTTNIVNAKDNGTQGLYSKGEIYNVSVSIIKFASVSHAKAENTATVSTLLKSNDFKTDDLKINSYLNSSAAADSTGTNVSLGISVDGVKAVAKDTSTMDIQISGTNTVTGTADIKGQHDSKTSADLSAFNFSLLAGGASTTIDTELTANTTGNISGNFNAAIGKINLNTTRESSVSKSSGGGGIIAVNDPDVTNKLTGSSTLTIDGMKTSTEKGQNNWNINNTSTNTFDVVSSDGAGGLISVSSNGMHTTFNTSTTTNIKNSDINSEETVGYKVENTAVINESASNSGGGFVAVTTNNVDNSYTSNAKLSIQDTKINAKNINLQTTSDSHIKNNKEVEYTGGAGGFIAVNDFYITNTLNQNSEIDIKNSTLRASEKFVVNEITKSLFKQKIESNGYGFISVPRAYNTLKVNNTNKLTLDSASKLLAGDQMEINFDSNDTLSVRTVSDARNFAGKPSAYAWLYLTVNNTLDDNGSIEAGNLVDINFMKNSLYDLSQHAYSECHAAVAATNEGGTLNQTVKNTLNVKSNADIISGKDVEISYSRGTGKKSSYVGWKTVSYACFGIPISDSDDYTVYSTTEDDRLNLDGDIIAGQANGKYMKINRDGSIDKSVTTGFYDDEYTVSDGEFVPGSIVKQKTLNSIKIELDNVEESLTDVNNAINEITPVISELNEGRKTANDKLNDINGLLDDGYEMKNSKTDESGNSDFNTIVQNDMKAIIISTGDEDPNKDKKITQDQYNTIMNDYSAKLSEIETQNQEIFEWNSKYENRDNQKELIQNPTMKQFLETKDYSLTDDQKTTISSGYDTVHGNIKVSSTEAFTTYENSSGKYVAVKNPTTETVEGVEKKTCDEITSLNNEISNFDSQITPYNDKLATLSENKAMLTVKKTGLQQDYDEVVATPDSEYDKRNGSYEIVFNDIIPQASHIMVDGITNNEVHGSGNFKVAQPGLKIDNYSTRTLVFNDIDLSGANNSGLFIGGQTYAEFAGNGTNQAVNGTNAYKYIYGEKILGIYITQPRDSNVWTQVGTSGAHYVSSSNGISGITVNNYYDINHPFASTFATEYGIPNPTTASHIYFIGDINTNGNFNVWNESGCIEIVTDNYSVNKTSLISTNNSIFIADTSASPFVVKSGDYLFASGNVGFIVLGETKIEGEVKTGYTDRSITITDDMIKPENLIVDNTSGERNMINLGGTNVSPYLNDTNNLKAIYKDGQIYLYNIPEQSLGGVFTLFENDNNIVTGKVTMADGFQKITIKNETLSQLNVADITNNSVRAFNLDEFTVDESATVVRNKLDDAETNIISKGKLAINGHIKNDAVDVLVNNYSGHSVLNISADNGLDINSVIGTGTFGTYAIMAAGDVNITTNSGDTNVLGKINSRGNVNIKNEGTGILNLASEINENGGNIIVNSNALTNITGVLNNEEGSITITSKGLSLKNTEDDTKAKITDNNGDITITNSANTVELAGSIIANSGNLTINNGGTSATVGGTIVDEKGDLTINNTAGDMTISAQISHDTVNNNSNGMISITNTSTAGKLTIETEKLETKGAGKTIPDGEVNVLAAILIDNESDAYGLALNSDISARVGDIIIKNKTDKLTIGGSITEGKGNIKVRNDGVNGAEISGTILDNEGNINITSIGLKTTEDSSITTRKGDMQIKNIYRYDSETDTTYSGKMNLSGIITDNDGTIVITSYDDAVVGGLITGEKGNIGISNMGGEMTVSADVNLNYLNPEGDGYIFISSYSSAKKLDITGNIINWGAGHTSLSGTTGISITNSTSRCEGINVSGTLSSRIGDIDILNEYGKLTTTADAVISNTEKGAIIMTNAGNNGAEIRGTIIATDGDINIKNVKNDLYVNAEIKEHKGNITIQNSENTGTALTYLGNTTNENGNTTVTNNGTGIVQAGATIHNNDGNVTVTNNGENLVYTGKIDNTRGDVSITNKNGLVHIYGDIANKGGDVAINNEGNSTEIKNAKITNETLTNSEEKISGNITIHNEEGIFRIEEDALISNTSAYADKGILITNSNYGDQFQMYGRVESLDKGAISIINNGKVATITGDIYAKEGSIGVTNSNAGELVMSGTVTNNKGDITIFNNSDDGAQIGGLITGEQGDIEIGNNGGDLSVTAQTTLNYIKQDANGKIKITNSNPDGNNVKISGSVTNYGKGGADGVAILVDNYSATGGTAIDGTLSSRLGDIVIKNAAKGLSVSGMVSVYEKGGVSITNSGANGTEISGTVLDKEGNITLNNSAGVVNLTQTGKITDNKGNISITNTAADKGTTIAGEILANAGDITMSNAGDKLSVSGSITDDKGDVSITNTGANGTEISGTVNDKEGNLTITNSNTGNNSGIMITTTGIVSDANGVANITNKGGKGITVEGYIRGDNANININNENSDIKIGEFTSDNDKYIDVNNGNVVITQTNGNILNGIVDPSNSTHTNYDLANPNHSYKTLISTTGDSSNLVMNVTDGDVGAYSNTEIPAGKSIDATTRDYTDSINVNVEGSVSAQVLNGTKTDERLVNLRAKESDLIVDSIKADGNIILTSSDWRQEDTRPTPEGNEYYTGYSILRADSNNGINVEGQNISIIASNSIGADGKKLKYLHDSDVAPDSSVSFEAENDLFMSGKAKGEELKIYQMVTKRGSIDFDMETNADIKEITAGNGLRLTQKAQNLTVRNLGLPVNPEGETSNFTDILNPHDDLVYGPSPVTPEKSVVPNYVIIRVLDAIDTPDRADSNLYIYSADVKGNHGANTQYYEDGSRLADVTLMADNIYAASFKAPNSKVSTKENPHGVKIGGGTYTNEDFDPTDTNVYEMKGINAYGDGEPISVDVLGVDKDIVDALIPGAQRNNYIKQTSKTKVPTQFRNKSDRTAFYNYDFKADNVYLSVNDYVDTNRGVSIDTIYADNAYINTHDTNLSVEDGFINNYAEFRNKTKLAVVDNDYRRTVNSDVQLFTRKTGSFSLGMSNSTILRTVAPVVDFDPYRLVNTYNSENSFVNLTFKETAIQQHNKDEYKLLKQKNDYYNKSVSLVFNTLGCGLLPENEIYEVSKSGAVVNANDLKVGQGVNVKLQFNDVDIDVQAKVKEIHGDKAKIQFLNIPEEISNGLMYEYMKKINAMKNTISSL